MADLFRVQIQYATSKEILWYQDQFYTEDLGYSRIGQNPSSWPSEPAGLPNNAYAVWKTPSTAPVPFELKGVLNTAVPGGGSHTVHYNLSPKINPNSGWTDGAGNFGLNPSTGDEDLVVLAAGERVTLLGDDRRLMVWVENDKLGYFGRFVPARPDVDPFPVTNWVGARDLPGLVGFKRVDPADNLSVLADGFVSLPRHPSDAAKDPLAAGNGQDNHSTDWVQYAAEVHWVEGGKKRHSGWLDRVFVMESVNEKKVWGEGADVYASYKGILHTWQKDKVILT